jgi:hypothetical protein
MRLVGRLRRPLTQPHHSRTAPSSFLVELRASTDPYLQYLATTRGTGNFGDKQVCAVCSVCCDERVAATEFGASRHVPCNYR